MQKYVIEKSLSKHLTKINGGKSQANDDKGMNTTRDLIWVYNKWLIVIL